MEEMLTIMGALLIIEGIPYFLFPGRVRDWAMKLKDAPVGSLRTMGALSVAAGLAILLAVRFL